MLLKNWKEHHYLLQRTIIFGVTVAQKNLHYATAVTCTTLGMSLEQLLTGASRAIAASAAVARSVETGLNLIGQTEAAQTIHSGQQALEATAHNIAVAVEAADLVLQDAATFLQPLVSTTTGNLLTSAPNHLQGTTTGDEAAASDARISSSSTVQDLQSAAAAPQLSTTHDPLPSTDPAVPWQNEQEGNQGLQNLLLYPSDEAMLMDVINSIDYQAVIQYI